MKYDFTIFGSGISAKISAIALAKNDFNICMISDRDFKIPKSSNNLVTFLSSGSLYFLTSIIKNYEFLKIFTDIHHIQCLLENLSGKTHQLISFNDQNNSTLGKIVKNNSLEQLLDTEIEQSKNIKIINANLPISIENQINKVEIVLENGEKISSDLFLLLSPKNTKLLERSKIKFVNKDFEQVAVSISMKGVLQKKNTAYQKFTSDGPIALLPYLENEAAIVWSLKNNSLILTKDNDLLKQTIDDHLSDYFQSTEIIDIKKYPLTFSFAENLFFDKTVLLGNLAHNIHPIAGQGLNLSIKDISLLTDLVCKYRDIGYVINNPIILNEFNIKRKIDNTAYSFGTLSLDQILTSNNKLINLVTRKGISMIEKNNMIKKLIVNSAVGKNFFRSF